MISLKEPMVQFTDLLLRDDQIIKERSSYERTVEVKSLDSGMNSLYVLNRLNYN